MSQVKIKMYLCIDEHGNYQAVGSSKITEENKHEVVATVESGIRNDDTNTTTTSFQVNIELPTPKEKDNEIHNVSQ